MAKIKRVAIYLNQEDQKLMEEVDRVVKENYMNRSRFTLMAWKTYLKFLKRRTY